MENGTQLIVCSVENCTHHQNSRCGLPQIEVSFSDKNADIHQTKCLNFKKSCNC